MALSFINTFKDSSKPKEKFLLPQKRENYIAIYKMPMHEPKEMKGELLSEYWGRGRLSLRKV